MDAEKIHDLNLIVVAIRRQEMHLSSLANGLANHVGKAAHWQNMGHATFFGHAFDGCYGAIPNDVVNINFVTDQVFFTRIGINDTGQSVAVLSVEIQKRAVLAEFICV